MYASAVIAARQQLLESQMGELLPLGALERYPVAYCHAMVRDLEGLWDQEKGQPTRSLSQEEEAFVTNESMLCKIDYRYAAERYCNPPEAPIWMGDLSFKPLGDVQVGDTVIGWQKQERTATQRTTYTRERLVKTRVVAVARRRAPLVRITLASGRVIRCTPDHQWSQGKLSNRYGTWRNKKTGTVRKYYYPWITAAVGRTLSRVVDPVVPDPIQARLGGWLGGVYDGEGCGPTIAQYRAHNPEVCDRIEQVGRLLGLSITPHASGRAYTISGGRQGYLRFLLLAQPVKRQRLERAILTTQFRTPDTVIAVEPDGVGEVVSLQTETGNYVAWGYASKNCFINYEGQSLRPMYPLWESQELILAEVARIEEAHWRARHPDGILGNILKGRQLGASTLCQSFLAHRCLTHGHVRTLIASDVPQNSGSEGLFGMLELVVEHWPWWLKPREKFHTKNHHLMWANGSRVIVESGKSMKGGLQEEGAEKGQIGRSKTYSAFHLSEITSWERPEQINSSLLPAVPYTPRTFGMRESTAMGRNNYWHNEWKLAAAGEDPRFFNVFIPWYAERSKYWLPTPAQWVPSDDTLNFARRASEHGPLYMHRPVTLAKEQLYWYELHKNAAIKREELYKFLSEYPSEPEEAFQNSGRSIFTIETQTRVGNQARPMADLWSVAPRSELIADKEASLAEFRVSQAQLRSSAAQQKERSALQVLETNDPTIVREETPTLTEIEP